MNERIEAEAPALRVGGERWIGLSWLLCAVWLPALAFPIADLLASRPSSWRLVVILGGVTLFAGIYLWTGRQAARRIAGATSPRRGIGHVARVWLPIAVLCVLSVLITLGDGKRWLGLFIFTAAVLAFSFPPRRAFAAIAPLLLLGVVCGWLAHDALGDLLSGTFFLGVTAITTAGLVQLMSLIRQLRAAREQIARLAVAEERLRFARDLHDLLGHSLSLIALKSELAGRLAVRAPERAAAEMRDVETVARDALQEVRAAVAGYRQPTLAGELHGAARILDAAGIALHLEGAIADPPPALEGVLSWTVREGVTNVIRHSRARHCTICLLQDGTQLGIEVRDDGRGAAPPSAAIPGASGSGLAGLAERVAACGGHVAVGPGTEGGFHLAVRVPLERAACATDAGPAAPAVTIAEAG